MFIFCATIATEEMNMGVTMPVPLIKNPIEVGNRLEGLGLLKDQAIEIVAAMVAARRSATENDPPAAGAWLSWQMGTRRAREVTVTDARTPGWERDETGQISSVVNRALGIRLIVSNTDDGTCLDDREPQNRSKKGAATDSIVMQNQGSFMDVLDSSMTVVPLRQPEPSDAIVTWYLCVFCGGDEVRAELSCPVDVENGFFTRFIDRIAIVGPGDGTIDPVRRRRPDDDGDIEFDIPVIRK